MGVTIDRNSFFFCRFPSADLFRLANFSTRLPGQTDTKLQVLTFSFRLTYPSGPTVQNFHWIRLVCLVAVGVKQNDEAAAAAIEILMGAPAPPQPPILSSIFFKKQQENVFMKALSSSFVY